MDYPHIFEPPPIVDVSCSDWLLLSIENDHIDKIYAMRVLPLHDLVAFKLKYIYEHKPESVIISRPELFVLKYIWDCGNAGFNRGIIHYLQHSKHALFQFSNRKDFLLNDEQVNSWYYDIILGKNV